MGLDVNQFRNWLNNNSAVVTIGAVVVLIIALYIIITSGGSSSSGPRGPIDVYFFDSKTGEAFIDKNDKIPPFDSPAGGQAYRAYVFNCGQCDGETDFTGYLEKFSDEHKELVRKMKEASESGGTGPDGAIFMESEYGKGRFFSVDGKTWYQADSSDAMKITRAVNLKCKGKGKLKPCYPGR